MPPTDLPAQITPHGKPAAAAAGREGTRARGARTFPIVGVGASAGGLEALTRFFRHADGENGVKAAYIVIQHQDPDRPSTLPELLQRHTRMPVVAARSRQKIRSGHVYVFPGNKELSILHGTLHLLEPVAGGAPRLPVDQFFRALAADRQEYAVGVILSGMGSDGTLGLRALKEKAGLTLAQTPATAAFASMPESAIGSGLVDIVVPPEDMPGQIAAYFHTAAQGMAAHAAMVGAKPQSALETIVILLRERTGNDFSLYKKSTLYRRIEHRMALHQIVSIVDYIHYLRDNPDELECLFEEFLIGVTSFFRDPAAWTALIEKALPALLDMQPAETTLRAWVPACSSGEEAYSLAIAFREALNRLQPQTHYALRIFATDLDETAIEQARSGFYPANIAADITPERLTTWFVEENKGYRIKPEIRDMVIFAPQNVIMDPPFTRLDIISCRNLLIYLAQDLQDMLLPLFHYSLNYHGILMLGSSESLGRFTHLFYAIDDQQRIYRRLERTLPATEIEFPLRPRFAIPAAHGNSHLALETPPLDIERLRAAAQASQEELTSANEELQTTNEELTTQKEEMQSLNQELQTINRELHAKVAQMTSVTSDMENLLDSTEISTVFLDAGFNIRRFTPNAKTLFKLRPVDIGRPLSDIVSILDYQDLLDDAGKVLRTLISSERTVLCRGGHHFRVRIMPYRNLEHIIDGVVVTFTDISEFHAWRSTVIEARGALRDGLANLSTRQDRGAALEQLLHKVQMALQTHARTDETTGEDRR